MAGYIWTAAAVARNTLSETARALSRYVETAWRRDLPDLKEDPHHFSFRPSSQLHPVPGVAPPLAFEVVLPLC